MNSAVLINDFSNGGAEKVLSNILNMKESNPKIITIWPSDFHHINDDVYILVKNKKNTLLDLGIAIFRLYRFCKENKIESINSFLFWSNYINVFVSFFIGHKTICTHCVSLKSKFYNKRLQMVVHKFLVKFLISKSSFHIYKSNDMKQEYEQIIGCCPSQVIYNPLFLNKLKKYKSLGDEYHDFKFHSNKKYIICVGRFHKTKNQKKLIESLTRLPIHFQVIFLGDGPELNPCIKLAQDLGLSGRLHFLGQVKNPYYFLSKSHIFVSLSLSEGFPNALLEAIALNCFPIVFDCPTGPKEILSKNYQSEPIKGGCGFLVYRIGILLNNCESCSLVSAIDYLEKYYPRISIDERKSLLRHLDPNFIRSEYEKVWSM